MITPRSVGLVRAGEIYFVGRRAFNPWAPYPQAELRGRPVLSSGLRRRPPSATAAPHGHPCLTQGPGRPLSSRAQRLQPLQSHEPRARQTGRPNTEGLRLNPFTGTALWSYGLSRRAWQQGQIKYPSKQCTSSAPAPPKGATGGSQSGQLCTLRARPGPATEVQPRVQPPRLLELAASKVADSTAFVHAGQKEFHVFGNCCKQHKEPLSAPVTAVRRRVGTCTAACTGSTSTAARRVPHVRADAEHGQGFLTTAHRISIQTCYSLNY